MQKVVYDESYGIYGRLILYHTNNDQVHFLTMLCKDGAELQPLKDALQMYRYKSTSFRTKVQLERARIYSKIRFKIYEFCYGQDFIASIASSIGCDKILTQLNA